METINTLLPILYAINLTLCVGSFFAIIGAITFKTLKAVKNYLF
jgi:hypothetical protein